MDDDVLCVTEKKNFYPIAKEAREDKRLDDCGRTWHPAQRMTTYTNGKKELEWFLKNPKAIMMSAEEPPTSAPGTSGSAQNSKRRVVKQMAVPENFC